jgi:hypothetical protein
MADGGCQIGREAGNPVVALYVASGTILRLPDPVQERGFATRLASGHFAVGVHDEPRPRDKFRSARLRMRESR